MVFDELEYPSNFTVSASFRYQERHAVKNMQKQSDLTSKNQATDLIRQAKMGDQKAFEGLLERYAPLIDSMTSRFGSSLPTAEDREDLRQEAVLGFYRAVLRFDTEQDKVQFGLYAKECIRNGLISHLRSIERHKNVVLLNDGFEGEEVAEDDPARMLVEEESYLVLSRQIRESLSSYENRIWWLYLSGRTAKEIAAVLGKDEKSVQNAIYRIRRKLRETLPYS